MLIGLLARRWCKSPKHLYTIRLQKRKPGLDKDQGLLTVHDFTPPIILYAQLKVYKLPLKIKLRALLIRLGLPVLFLLPFLSFSSLFFVQDDWMERGGSLRPLTAWASKTHSRRCLRWGTFSYLGGCLQPLWSEQVWCHELYWCPTLTSQIKPLSLPFCYSFAKAVLLRISLNPTGRSRIFLSVY